jgi:excisionase family DNA binding protein
MPIFRKLYIQNENGIHEINREGQQKKYSVEDVRQMITQRLYTLDLASYYLGIPVKTLRQMIADGEIPFIRRESKNKSRRLYYLDKQDMDEWIRKHKQQREPI